jgi:hypothetical protein
MSSQPVSLIYITDDLAQKTAVLLDSFARTRPSEGVVYWFGVENAKVAVVTTLIVPDADTTGGRIRTSAAANALVISNITGTPLVYLGQAHSHPGHSVGHSCVDDQETFARFDGAISVVVPWFGRYGLRLCECGIYRHIDGRFREISQVENHLRILPGLADLRHTAKERDSNAQ